MTMTHLPTKTPAGAPEVTQPIAQREDDRAIAPWPSIDKTGSLVIGPGLSLAYISAVFRLSMQGYRQTYVDLLDEMLEKDPGTFSVLSKRVMGVSSGRLEITAAKCEAGSADETTAQDIARVTSEMIDSIPAMEERLTEMAWALYYGIVGHETHWVRDGRGWMADRLSLVHSRRLSYPVSGSWDLYVWDQGWVYQTGRPGLSNNMFGFRIADAPGKFVIHAPQIRGGYPTRNGLGRQLAYWMALKLVAARGAPIYLERFAKPLPEATYSTGPEKDKAVTPADEIAKTEAALEAMGAGSLANWVHSDRVTMQLRTPDTGSGGKLTFGEWIPICDGQIAKCTLGGTLGTDVGKTGGNRALGDTQRKSEMALYKHDAGMLCSSLKRDLVSWIVRLNFPSAPARLYPTVRLHVEDDPDPIKVMDKAAKGAGIGMPIDADELAKEVGLTLIKPGDTKARRLFPILAQKDPAAFDADLRARAAALDTEFPAPEADDDTASSGTAEDGENDDNPDESSDEEA